MDHGACSGAGAVADTPGDALALGESVLCSLDSLDDLARWRDEVVNQRRQAILGISAAADAAGRGSDGTGAGVAQSVAISRLEALLEAAIDRMRGNGELAIDADPARLATALTAALHGGSLLAKTTQDISRLEIPLDLALSDVRSHSAR
jgi:TetR/AcrR family transcriptional repressor of nem operon